MTSLVLFFRASIFIFPFPTETLVRNHVVLLKGACYLLFPGYVFKHHRLNIAPRLHERTQIPVHPHVCGAVATGTSCGSQSSGSSPRVWGGLRHPHNKRGFDRFIPTCVGRFSKSQEGISLYKVHPHVCGAVIKVTIAEAKETGSSPRVWGGLRHPHNKRGFDRFIPTCVGRFADQAGEAWARKVHPHVCGAVVLIMQSAIAEGGSSPRVWGGSPFSFSGKKRKWFIPTCVGRLDR